MLCNQQRSLQTPDTHTTLRPVRPEPSVPPLCPRETPRPLRAPSCYCKPYGVRASRHTAAAVLGVFMYDGGEILVRTQLFDWSSCFAANSGRSADTAPAKGGLRADGLSPCQLPLPMAATTPKPRSRQMFQKKKKKKQGSCLPGAN